MLVLVQLCCCAKNQAKDFSHIYANKWTAAALGKRIVHKFDICIIILINIGKINVRLQSNSTFSNVGFIYKIRNLLLRNTSKSL